MRPIAFLAALAVVLSSAGPAAAATPQEDIASLAGPAPDYADPAN